MKSRKKRPKPLSIAHRGFSDIYPQNTIIAFQKAIELKVDAIELDVSLSRDGHMIVFHDSEVSRLTDGEGFIKDLTLSEIKQLDAGVRYGDQYRGTKIPTLSEAVEVICKSDVRLCIELKARHDDLKEGIERKVLQILRNHDCLHNTMFTSYNGQVVKSLSEMCPGLLVGYDPSPEQTKNYPPDAILAICNEYKANAVLFDHRFVTSQLVRAVHCADLQIFVWTVNKPRNMLEMIDLSVDGIMTNCPDILTKFL